MRILYEEWQCLSIGSPMANQLQQLENKIEDFVGISFTHHMEILHITATLDERIYYIHQVNLHHWNKYVLREYLSDDLYHHQGNMPNNFPKVILGIKQSRSKAIMFSQAQHRTVVA